LNCDAFCPGPISMATSNVTLNSAIFNWSVQAPLAVTFQLRYRIVGTAAWTFISNAASPYSALSLNCGADYEWQVRTNCNGIGSLTYSPWSVKTYFSTLNCAALCPQPTALSTTNIALYSAALNWTLLTPAPVGFDIRYRLAGTASWTQVDNVTSPYVISGLTCSSNYEWEARTVCGNSVSNDPFSVWTATQTFTTTTCTFACPSPNGLSASSITNQSASLSWLATAPGSVTYQYRYRINGTTPWTPLINNTTGSPVAVSGLTCNTVYQWQVRTVCGTPGNISYSAWSSLSTFSTAACLVNAEGKTALNNTIATLPIEMKVYPNPANESLKISLYTSETSQMKYEMRDVVGKLVYSGNMNITDGINEVEIETGLFHQGWYSITVFSNNNSATSRIMIMH